MQVIFVKNIMDYYIEENAFVKIVNVASKQDKDTCAV